MLFLIILQLIWLFIMLSGGVLLAYIVLCTVVNIFWFVMSLEPKINIKLINKKLTRGVKNG